LGIGAQRCGGLPPGCSGMGIKGRYFRPTCSDARRARQFAISCISSMPRQETSQMTRFLLTCRGLLSLLVAGLGLLPAVASGQHLRFRGASSSVVAYAAWLSPSTETRKTPTRFSSDVPLAPVAGTTSRQPPQVRTP
jgi:hypothetical protein